MALMMAILALGLVATDYFAGSGVRGSDSSGSKSVDGARPAPDSNHGAQIDARIKMMDDRLAELAGRLTSDPPGEGDLAAHEKLEALEAQIALLMAKAATEDAQRQASRTELAELQKAANDPFLRQQFAKATNMQQQRQVEVVEELFGSEDIDPNWAPKAREQLERNLATSDAFFLANVVDMQCRTSVCRVDLAVPEDVGASPSEGLSSSTATPMDTELVLLATVSRDMPMGTMRREPDGAGGYRYRIYLHRDGYVPPKASNPLEGMTVPQIRTYLENL
ncbi:hypothetical protein [Thiocapsa sp.]|uniref:hypothetical protein n=1 Tax=Thiocapsa sp. TaxID=2024551 RepID=UPI002D7E4EA9|nr:hypothetical protein [Thiocapsa sp.]